MGLAIISEHVPKGMTSGDHLLLKSYNNLVPPHHNCLVESDNFNNYEWPLIVDCFPVCPPILYSIRVPTSRLDHVWVELLHKTT